MLPRIRTNQYIRVPELRVIGSEGENLGVMKTEDAFALARERGLDLIEVAPNANPPVARIMSFDKFRFEYEKKLKKEQMAARKSRGNESKQVQVSVRAAANDLAIKAKRADGFLKEGYSLIIVVTLRGREKAHKERAGIRLNQFLTMLETPHRPLGTPRWGGRGLNLHIAKK